MVAHPEISGIHDLVVHDYGPGRVMISLHAEVPASGNFPALHDVIDNVEHELWKKLGCEAVLSAWIPLADDNGATQALRAKVETLVQCIDPSITIHDFRTVPGPTHTNLIFDVVVPFGFRLSDAEVARQVLCAAGGTPTTAAILPWCRWITPTSVERFRRRCAVSAAVGGGFAPLPGKSSASPLQNAAGCGIIKLASSRRAQRRLPHRAEAVVSSGDVPKRLKGPHSKCGRRCQNAARVRISPSPPAQKFLPPFRFRYTAKAALWQEFFRFHPANASLVCRRRKLGAMRKYPN